MKHAPHSIALLDICLLRTGIAIVSSVPMLMPSLFLSSTPTVPLCLPSYRHKSRFIVAVLAKSLGNEKPTASHVALLATFSYGICSESIIDYCWNGKIPGAVTEGEQGIDGDKSIGPMALGSVGWVMPGPKPSSGQFYSYRYRTDKGGLYLPDKRYGIFVPHLQEVKYCCRIYSSYQILRPTS